MEKRVSILDRKDITEANVMLDGVYFENEGVRGVRAVASVHWTDGDVTYEMYDELAGWDFSDYGGWNLSGPIFERMLNDAAEWLRNKYEPPYIDV